MAENYRQVKTNMRTAKSDADRTRRLELRAIVVDMRQKIRQYGITLEQLFGPDLSDLVRYRHPVTGQTWNGKGRPPNWIRNEDRNRFQVD